MTYHVTMGYTSFTSIYRKLPVIISNVKIIIFIFIPYQNENKVNNVEQTVWIKLAVSCEMLREVTFSQTNDWLIFFIMYYTKHRYCIFECVNFDFHLALTQLLFLIGIRTIIRFIFIYLTFSVSKSTWCGHLLGPDQKGAPDVVSC